MSLRHIDHLQGTPAILTVPVLSPCLRAEQMHITVDTHTGMLRCHVPKHLDCPIVTDLEESLNKDQSKLPVLVGELRHWITRRRCEKTLQHLPANAVEQIPLLHEVDQKKAKVGEHQIYVTFHRHPNIVLVNFLAIKNDCDSLSAHSNRSIYIIDCCYQAEHKHSM